MKEWRLAVNATNLTDERSVATCGTPTRCFHGAERNVLARLSCRW